jgi:hypothetical protein
MWTTGDIAILRTNGHLGAAALASLLGRSEGAVRQAARRHRISLRRRGETRGTLLGQPRGIRLRDLLPEAVAADRELAALVLERQRVDETADLCPRCATRPASVKQTGLCPPCHKRRLAEVHRDLIADQEASRDLWQSRQALKRTRDAAGTS